MQLNFRPYKTLAFSLLQKPLLTPYITTYSEPISRRGAVVLLLEFGIGTKGYGR